MHYEYKTDHSRWNIKLQAMLYRIPPAYATSAELDFVEMGAYGSNYNVATKEEIYTAGIAYPLVWMRKQKRKQN